MKCGHAKVTGFGKVDGVFHRLLGANLTDQNHVRRLTQRVLKRGFPAVGVHSDLTLGNDAAQVGVNVLHRVFNGDDVALGFLVAQTQHRGQ